MLSGAKALVRLILGLLATALLLASCHKLTGEYEIAPHKADPNAGDGLCTPGEWKCNREFLLECTADRKLVPRATCPTANQCDQNAKVCTVCPQEGDRRCNGAKREVCAKNRASWDAVETCAAEDQCSPKFCGDCTPGELQCSGPLTNELRVCTADNRWQTVDSCQSASLCMASVSMGMSDMTWTPACLMPVCEAGALSCDGSVLYRCRQGRDGLDKVDVCSSPALCQMAATAPDGQSQAQSMCPLGCAPAGSFRCTGQNVEQCSFDQTTWAVVATCDDTAQCDSMTGECGGPCVPGAQRCNAASLETCSAEQTWVVKEVCATGALCNPGEAACRAPACVPDGMRCNPDNPLQLERCNDDRTGYTSVASCQTAELCSCALDNSCTAGIDQDGCGMPVCMPLENAELPLRCDPADILKVQSCDPSRNRWNPLTTCNGAAEPKEFCFPQDPTDPCKTDCPASGFLCDGTELLSCGLNGPVHQADCATATLCECVLNGTCAAGVGATGCGSPLCGGTLASNQCIASTLQTCQLGRNGWNETQCGMDSLCYPGIPPAFAGGYCAICEIPGVVSCTDTANAIHTCAPDRRSYTAETPCAFGCLERVGPSADYCAACAEGEVRCNGTAPGASRIQQCNADRSALVDVVGGLCANGCLDLGTADQCAVCQANEFRCEGTQRMRCNPTRTGLTLDTACNPSCIDSGIADYCGTCTPGATQCSGDLLQTCQASGAWNTGSSCANGCVVKDGNDNCAPTCRPGTYRCTGSPATALQQCNANGDGWTAMSTCATNDAGTGGAALCDAVNGRCDACVAGDYRCSAGTLQDCNANGDWKTASGPCSGTTLRTCGAGTGPATASTCTICDASNRECDDCNPTTEPYSCSSGTLRSCNPSGHWVSGVANCSGATLRTCTGNTLNPAQTCTICDETNNECDDCSGSTFRCTGTGSTTLQSCNSTGHWMASPACPSTGSTLYTCSTGTSSPATSTCPAGQTCNAAQTLCNMCDNGQTRCFDMDTQQTCATMMWGSNLECGVAGCQSNTCNDCLPSTWKACNTAGTQLLTCAANGDYPATGLACPNGCFGDEPNAYCGDCTPGDTACFGGSIRTCGANGRYPTTGGTPCGANGCFETTPGEAACGVCPGTTTQCVGKQRQTCSSGQWTNTGATCTGNCALVSTVATCVACNVTADCATGVCDTAAHTCEECLADNDCVGDDVCSATNECVACEDDTDCTGNDVCTAANECVECEVDGDCVDGVCTAGNECVECEVNGDCGPAGCNTTTNTCNDCVPSTSTSCNAAETQLLTCGVNGSYPTTGMACPNGCFGTAPSAYCGDCTPGDTACFSGSIRTCGANGMYPATGGTPCGANGCFETTPGVAACGVCSGTSTQCMGKQRQTCSSGQWSNTGAACTGNCALVATVATCVACNVTADCATGVCDTAAHTCEECLADNDCAGNDVCSATNECVTCEVDADCTGNDVCTAANECVECEVSTDCAMGVCRTADNTCVECLVNADCAMGTPTCNITTNVCE